MKPDSELLRSYLSDILSEYLQARQVYSPVTSAHEGWAVIWEELDELWDEVKANKGYTVTGYQEARQVAAMALAYMIEVAPHWMTAGYADPLP